MATKDALQPSSPNTHTSKRKLPSDSHDLVPKKRRAAGLQTRVETERGPPTSTSTTRSYSQVYNPVLSKLGRKFDVKVMSVMPSTNISKHVDRALEHLGRFNAWDQTVLPGVVLLCAKSAASSKLITIAELTRRRVGESNQKWFQYSLLSETVIEEAVQPAEEPSVVEDTFMVVDREGMEGTVDDYFETIQPTIHERAVQPAKVRHKAHITVLLSRVPLDELNAEKNVSLQTNEQHVEHLRKKRMGLVA
ncbi:uncharacterized protein B0T15DRAFT_194636 [Chaetomium strumarium]|uniref:DNA/RNA-binding protein Alba-like domain-containing protein n=1 Tax=Chaetomium strumarium TaxID=1170767 RepID=A0AAJ0M1C5_9PEZI|nr:hypothetical protein B0T15DRAFT_194636 [Chaetomium strumarium]